MVQLGKAFNGGRYAISVGGVGMLLVSTRIWGEDDCRGARGGRRVLRWVAAFVFFFLLAKFRQKGNLKNSKIPK